MDTVGRCSSCLCNTCQLNVEAGLNIRRCEDMYCYNCDACCELFGNHFRYIEPGECELFRNGSPIRMRYSKKFKADK